MDNTNALMAPPCQADDLPPTFQVYGELQQAYDFLNFPLFSGALPPCLITLQRHSVHVYGYYSNSRFGSNHLPGRTTDEIALNPIHFMGCDVTEVLQTLVHEMCHLWQFHFGKPSRRGYHNHEWAAKMMQVGLYPSSTGKPGGRIVGQHMAEYVIQDGPFHQAVGVLAQEQFRISWYDRLAEVLGHSQHPQEPESPATYVVTGSPAQRPGYRQKFSCPFGHVNAWAKPTANILCGTCGVALQAARPRCAVSS